MAQISSAPSGACRLDPQPNSHSPSPQGFERLTDLVLSKAQPKQYRGQFLSGSAIATFAQVGGGVRGGEGRVRSGNGGRT